MSSEDKLIAILCAIPLIVIMLAIMFHVVDFDNVTSDHFLCFFCGALAGYLFNKIWFK